MANCHCHLKVVLFCSGDGANVNSYRPKRDESQWWNRRDALVRCVASFLFGPTSTINSSTCRSRTPRRELILLYDGDHARIHMALEEEDTTTTTCNSSDAADVFPSEEFIIALWKDAVSRATRALAASDTSKDPPVVRKGNLSCWAVLAPPPNDSSGSTTSAPPAINPKMTQNWNKRQLLEYLQNQCSMEFLREHRLNCSADVILRKTNRTALAKVFQAWSKSTQQHFPTSTEDDNMSSEKKKKKNAKTVDEKKLQAIFQDILRSFSSGSDDSSNKQTDIIAATLHESSESELPCFPDELDNNCNNNMNGSKEQPLNLCLFLGAVRDMIPEEYRALERACREGTSHSKTVPLAKVRLGWVPEFTSKILSIVAFHHAQGRLGPAMKKLISTGKKQRHHKQQLLEGNNHCKRNLSGDDNGMMLPLQATSTFTQPPQLHILCLVPLRSDELTLDLEQRSRSLWCLVRVLVCSLWRSRLASNNRNRSSSTRTVPLENTLSLIFLDGTYLTLQQHEWVSALAEQHQAAPSEYQVLKALIEMVKNNNKSGNTTRIKDTMDMPRHQQPKWRHRAPEVLNELVLNHKGNTDGPSSSSPRYILSMERGASTDLTRHFYQMTMSNSIGTNRNFPPYKEMPLDIWAMLPISPEKNDALRSDEKSVAKMHNSFLRALEADPLWLLSRQSLVDIAPPSDSSKRENNKSCVDWEASSISSLQHIIYQGRLCLGEVAAEVVPSSEADAKYIKSQKKKKKRKRAA